MKFPILIPIQLLHAPLYLQMESIVQISSVYPVCWFSKIFQNCLFPPLGCQLFKDERLSALLTDVLRVHPALVQ